MQRHILAILECSMLIVHLASLRIKLQPESENIDFETLAGICPLRPLVSHLRDALLTNGGPDPPRLNFPPVPLPSSAEAASTGGGT